MSQTYTAAGAVTIPTTTPRDEGGTLMLGSSNAQAVSAIGYNEFNYANARNRDAELYAELTDLIAKWCQASTTGLSTGTAALPYASVTPRECLAKLSFMIQSMLQQSSGS